MRQDEISREEIWQDVIRCNIDNYFFREPSTQRKLLDILFIYSKLNPDTGYRQGMHELLAPVLWVVYQDAVIVDTFPAAKKGEEGIDFMLDVLDSRYVEHDAFNLFCAIMQTAKTFYEVGDGKDSSAIVAQSKRIHEELLGAVDPDLSTHLTVVGIVPQIFAIRWLRLLFGREMDFKDLLKFWDILFAENLNIEIVDMACVAILLRLRWRLIDADYTTAITTLTKLDLPEEGDSVRAIVRDALELARHKTEEAGADITQLRTGRRQYTNPLGGGEPVARSSTPQNRSHRRVRSQHQTPSPSPARFTTPQKHLETLFSNVSNNFQKNAEGWSVQNVSKALKGAVGEARRNLEQYQVGHSRGSSLDIPRDGASTEHISEGINQSLVDRLKKLEERNQALAKMLEDVQETLRKWKATNPQLPGIVEDVFNTALAKMQFVSVYLSDSDIPIPEHSPVAEQKALKHSDEESSTHSPSSKQNEPNSSKDDTDMVKSTNAETRETQNLQGSSQQETTMSPTPRSSVRPSLAESSFSFMLGEKPHRSSFVRSTPMPEERRGSATQDQRRRKDSNEHKSNPRDALKDGKDRKTGKRDNSSDDGFSMSTFQ